jgi:hypothetical protein
MAGSSGWLSLLSVGAPAITRDLETWYRLHPPEGAPGGSALATGWGPYQEVFLSIAGAVTLVTWDTDDRLEWPPVLWPIWVAVPPG